MMFLHIFLLSLLDSGMVSSKAVVAHNTATSKAKVITHIPAQEKKMIAFTFDACERGKPAYFDQKLLSYIIENRIPCSIFVSGEFAKRNKAELRRLSKYPFIEFENHSWHHYKDMRRLKNSGVKKEVMENEKLITGITGVKPKYFRFPGGNCDARTIGIVNDCGLKVVHWTYASGDPDKNVSSEAMIRDAMARAQSGNILIFHINGRGVHTADAFPSIYAGLKEKGYTFVRLASVIR